MLAITGPRTSICVSRHGESGGLAPRYDLAVIAEVELEAVDEAAMGGERMHLHAGCPQGRHVTMRQIEAADAVVEEIDAHALRGFGKQRVLEHLAERVVAHDKELHDDVAASLVDRFEDRGEGGFAVHQRAHRITRQEGHAAQMREGAHELVAKRVGRVAGRRVVLVPCVRMRLRAQRFVLETARVGVTLELAAAEEQIRHQRQIRHSH
jgi:hypothetical protein